MDSDGDVCLRAKRGPRSAEVLAWYFYVINTHQGQVEPHDQQN